MKPGPRPGTPGYRPPRPVKERILQTVTVDENGCWLWPEGMRNRKGYGQSKFGSRVDGTYTTRPCHRVAYEAWKGPIPDGLEIDHLCANPPCCNPDHLEPVTNAENMRRKMERQTHCGNGHEWTEENTYIRPSGRRCCRACKRDANRRRYARKKALEDAFRWRPREQEAA